MDIDMNKRILIQLDISQLNVQWVNIGAGIWCTYSLNDYPFVDTSLLTGFSAQEFGNIGSVSVDGISLTRVYTLAGITNNQNYFYYDLTTKALYVSLVNYDEPALHTILIGIIYGYSYHDITPNNTDQPYEGRLASAPNIGTSRDPLFWGKISFDNSNLELINTDGELDKFAEDNTIYGNQVRIYYGDKDDDFEDYDQLYTGYIEQINISETGVSIGLIDRRKQFSKSVTYSCTAQNALDTIVDLLSTYYSIPYNDTFYDTTTWDSVQSVIGNVTIDMQEPESVIDIIEWICSSVFGLFVVEGNGRFSFKLIDQDAASEIDIEAVDIASSNSISYDPSEVISSVRVGYAKDWAAKTYTYLTDDSREDEIFVKYKTYNERTFETILPDLTSAEDFATTIYDYAENVKGNLNIRVPFDYYGLSLGDNVNVQVERKAADMLGLVKAEVISINYDLDNSFIEYGLRLIKELFILATEEDRLIITPDSYILV